MSSLKSEIPLNSSSRSSGEFKYYLFQLCCHDNYEYGANGNRFVMGYEALFSPFIPSWVIGEEFNNDKDGDYTRILYLNTLKRQDLVKTEKREYFESVKKMIAIRRKYSDIFEYFPENHKNSNISKVDTDNGSKLQAYARYSEREGVIIVPNDTDATVTATVKPRLDDMKLSGYDTYKLIDLNSGEVLKSGTETEIRSFEATVSAQNVGIYLIVTDGLQGTGEVYPTPEGPDVNADIVEYIPNTSDYFVPDVSDLIDFKNFWNTNVPKAEDIIESDVQRGIRLTYNGGDVGRRITTLKKYNPDGLSLKFQGLKTNNGSVGYPKITVMLSGSTELDKFRIMLDTNSGELSYYNGTVSPITIAQSDKLKYTELTEKEFFVTFNMKSDGSVLCTVVFSDNSSIQGIIPSRFVNLIDSFGSTPLFVAIGPGKSDDTCIYNFSLDFVGIRHDQSIIPQISSVKKVNGTRSSFETAYKNNLVDGVAFKFDGCNIGGCMMYTTASPIDGLKLRFEQLKKNVGYEDILLKFSICIADSTDAIPRCRIVFDTLNGTIAYYSGDNPYSELTVIASDDILKYKNLSDKPFEIVFKKLTNGNISVCLSLGNNEVCGVVPKEFYEYYVKNDNIYFGISSSNRNGYFSLALSGIEKVNTISFDEDWFTEGTLSVTNGGEYRLPIPNARAGHKFLGWVDSENNILVSGTRLLSTESLSYGAKTAYPGDVDCNGKNEANDLVLIKKYIMGFINEVADTADANCDSIIDIRDFVRIKKLISE